MPLRDFIGWLRGEAVENISFSPTEYCGYASYLHLDQFLKSSDLELIDDAFHWVNLFVFFGKQLIIRAT